MSNIVEWQLAGKQTAFPLLNSSLEQLSYSKKDIADVLFEVLIDASIILDSASSYVNLTSIYSSGGHIYVKVKFESGITAIGVDVDGVCYLTDINGYNRGAIVVDNISAPTHYLLKSIVFYNNEVQFDPCSYITIPNGVLESLTANSNVAAGRVRLVEGEGVRLVNIGNDTIRVDAIGYPSNDEIVSECSPDLYGVPLQYLRIIPPAYNSSIPPLSDTAALKPDLAGNVNVLSGVYEVPKTLTSDSQLLRVNPTGNGLLFSLIL